MNLEGLREAVAKGRSLARQTSLNPEPTVTIPLREAEALIEITVAVRELAYTQVEDYWSRQDREQKLWHAWNKLEAME